MDLRQRELLFGFLAVMLATAAAVAIGTRASTTGTDTIIYLAAYTEKLFGLDPVYEFEFLYELFSGAFAAVGLPVYFFFTAFSLMGFVVIAASAREMSVYFDGRLSANAYFFVLLITLIASPVFVSAQINVLRHGLASIFLVIFGLRLLQGAGVLRLAFLAILAVGFHYTSVIYLAAMALLRLPRLVVYLLVAVLFFTYVTGLSERLVQAVSLFLPVDVHGAIANYGAGFEYRRGVRLDFAVFSLAAGLAFTAAGVTVIGRAFRARFLLLVQLYWVLVIPFLMFGFGAFSDRFLFAAWLYLSWLAALVLYAILATVQLPRLVLAVCAGLAVCWLSVIVAGPVGTV